jgi:hypothetical protein
LAMRFQFIFRNKQFGVTNTQLPEWILSADACAVIFCYTRPPMMRKHGVNCVTILLPTSSTVRSVHAHGHSPTALLSSLRLIALGQIAVHRHLARYIDITIDLLCRESYKAQD